MVSKILKCGQRIRIEDDFATIKFVGHIPPWGDDVIAYGVEWDNPQRGKNDGQLEGFRYFITDVEGAGSFIKASYHKIQYPVLFLEALMNRYASEENARSLTHSIKFGLKTVENYGFEKLNTMMKDVSSLATIMLDKQNIGYCSDLPQFPGTQLLDISFNLLSQWNDVEQILQLFSNLQSLNLNGNRFLTTFELRIPHSLRDLSLAAMHLKEEQLKTLDFDGLHSLCLAGNKLTDNHCNHLILGRSLSKLDLSFNQLHALPSVVAASSVTELILADNRVNHITEKETYMSVKVLDLRNNDLSLWEDIDRLSKVFPSLEEIRIENCPIFAQLSIDEVMANLIARISNPFTSNIRKINGSSILDQEVENAELYFISKVRQGHTVITNEEQWERLIHKHHMSLERIHSSLNDSDKVLLYLKTANSSEMEVSSRVFLKSNTVLRLKGVISRQIKKPILEFHIFVSVDENQLHEPDLLRYLVDDTATLQSLGLHNGQSIFITWDLA